MNNFNENLEKLFSPDHITTLEANSYNASYFINISNKVSEKNIYFELINLNIKEYDIYLKKYLSSLEEENDELSFIKLIILGLQVIQARTSSLECSYHYIEFLHIILKKHFTSKFSKFLIPYFLYNLEKFHTFCNLFPLNNKTLEIKNEINKLINQEIKNVNPTNKTQFKDFVNYLGIDEIEWLKPLNSFPLQTKKTHLSQYLNILDEDLEKKYQTLPEDISEELYNNELRNLLGLTRIMFEISRNESLKNKKQNEKIEDLIQFSSSIINYYISNVDKYHPCIYPRILSLISAKNLIKIRYNVDNNQWENTSLLKDYLGEVLFILKNNLTMSSLLYFTKGVEELSKIKFLYNFFGIEEKVLEEYFLEEYLKLRIYISSELNEFNLRDKRFFEENLLDKNRRGSNNSSKIYIESASCMLSPIVFNDEKEINMSLYIDYEAVFSFWSRFSNIYYKNRNLNTKCRPNSLDFIYV